MISAVYDFFNYLGNKLWELFVILFGTTLLGYAPDTGGRIINSKFPDIAPGISHLGSPISEGFQHAVWTVTILVGLFAIIGAVQKQFDRYEKKKREKDWEDKLNEQLRIQAEAEIKKKSPKKSQPKKAVIGSKKPTKKPVKSTRIKKTA